MGSVFLLPAIFAITAKAQIASLNKPFAIDVIAESQIHLNDKQSAIGKKHLVIGTGSVLYVGGMAGLYQLWYADYENQKFHFFNDGNEWLQVDKFGHAFTTYQLSRLSNDALLWAGFSHKQACVYGTGYALLFQTTIEVFDGLSSAWGFSWFDMIANATGGGIFAGQQMAWQEQKVAIKFSYHVSPYANERPNILGNTPVTRLFKDYNGQTYWLSTTLNCWLPKSKLPQWFAISVGYGANGMTGGHTNPDLGKAYQRYRQFYISADIDLSRIKCKSKTLKAVLNTVNMIKIPMPTLGYDAHYGFKFYPLFF